MSDGDDFSTVATELAQLTAESPETIQASLAELSNSIEAKEERLSYEIERQKQWKTENERRRHNYVPLIFELLQQLARKNMLEGLF